MRRSIGLAGLVGGLAVGLGSALAGCDDTGGVGGAGSTGMATGTGTQSSSATGLVADAQTPPQSAAALDAWLASGDYKAWKCETAVHAARMPSPHGFNRVCSNDVISKDAAGSGDWKQGAAAVKELYAAETATAPSGYAVYLKIANDSAAGANWHYYERVPSGVVVDGFGSAGNAKTICVGCHAGAGSDVPHTPSPGGRDFVYTPVP